MLSKKNLIMTLFTKPMTIDCLMNWQSRDDVPFLDDPAVWAFLAWSVEHDNAIVFQTQEGDNVLAAGMVKNGDEAGVWVITAPAIERHVLEVVKRLPVFIRCFANLIDAKNIYALLDPKWYSAIRFAKLIGFEYFGQYSEEVTGQCFDQYNFRDLKND